MTGKQLHDMIRLASEEVGRSISPYEHQNELVQTAYTEVAKKLHANSPRVKASLKEDDK